jgi:hypothetical protein
MAISPSLLSALSFKVSASSVAGPLFGAMPHKGGMGDFERDTLPEFDQKK